MNRPIARLFGFVVLMFALLVAFTSRWTVFDAKALQNNRENHRALEESLDIKRGSIYAEGGTLLATSIAEPGGAYKREYPQGSLYAAAIGYAFPLNNQSAGLERYRNSLLTGTPIQQESLLDQLSGTQPSGDNVYTTLDPTAQEVAENALVGTGLNGAVVAMVPSTGDIRVLATNPTYNPNLIQHPAELARSEAGLDGPQVDRVIAAQDFPGSIEKVVTAIAAIDTGQFTPDSMIDGNSPQSFYGIPLHNDSNASYGEVTLTYALTNSINTVFANVAYKLGGAVLADYMTRLGYFRDPPIDLPSIESQPSGVRNAAGELVPSSDWDAPLVGIGEGQLEVTPLQMVMVASAVADQGRLMTPHLTNYVTNSDGVVIERVAPTLFSTVMKPSTAEQVGIMMQDVVSDGTAYRALYGFQYKVAGKTGTAELTNSANSLNDAWFIAYAPATDPKIAVAVDIEHTSEYGGAIAAPIARQVIQSILGSSG
ncbi:MAG: penicillin-binding transpeptidase domain-containing protein [Solirubrobacteraceae bacterium]|jgi:peptidoglycan glycosyltransferase